MKYVGVLFHEEKEIPEDFEKEMNEVATSLVYEGYRNFMFVVLSV